MSLLVAREAAALVDDALSRFYRKQVDADDWGNDRLHASDLGYATGELCLRQWWLRIHGAEGKPKTTGQALMFDHGHRIHERASAILGDVLPAFGWSVEAIEKPVECEGVTGRADLIITPQGHDLRVVVDWKTQRGGSFDYLDREPEAKATHVAQVQFYVMAEDADAGVVAYIDREGQNGWRCFPVERDDEATLERIDTMKATMASEEPPPLLDPEVKRSANKGPDSLRVGLPWQCRYCDYLDTACPGAIPESVRRDGIVAYDHGQEIVPKEGCEEIIDYLYGASA